MEENANVILMDKLTELSDLEINKVKVLTAIFNKTTQNILQKKVQSLESSFEEQAKFYGQKLSDYTQIYDEIIPKYKKQLSEIIEKYTQLFVNMQIELQEAECNQKIAITNLKKSFDIKEEITGKAKEELIEEYRKKIIACMQKKMNYDVIIKECSKEIDSCAINMETKINSLFSDKSNQIALRDENAFKKIINKISNFFTGEKKFNTYVIEPITVELDMMDSKLPDITNNIHKDTVDFVARIKQAKDETNTIFENMING